MLENIKVLISEEKINKRLEELAKKIEEDYKDEIVLISVLKGGVYFGIDLSKRITKNEVILDFVKASSYGDGEESSGNLDFTLDISTDIKGKDVLIVEDIIDSGLTLNLLTKYLKQKQPRNLKICTLLNKEARRKYEVKVDYNGFDIEDKFVIGYGLDYKGKYRNLPYIGYVEK